LTSDVESIYANSCASRLGGVAKNLSLNFEFFILFIKVKLKFIGHLSFYGPAFLAIFGFVTLRSYKFSAPFPTTE